MTRATFNPFAPYIKYYEKKLPFPYSPDFPGGSALNEPEASCFEIDAI